MSYSKRFEAGAASRNGILAAQLASKGFKARQPVFTGRGNYFKSVWKTEADLQVLLTGLGQTFEVVNVGPKPYPSCRYTHGPIDGALTLVAEHKIDAADIDEVRVSVGRRDFEVVFGGAEGLGIKQAPPSVVDAQFSIPYTVATAILNGGVFLDDFSLDAIHRPEVVSLARRVKPVVRDEFDVWPITVRPCEVEIVTRRGERLTTKVVYAKGNPRNPVSLAEIRENFVACARRTPFPLSAQNVAEARDMIGDLERVKDIADILMRLSPSEPATRPLLLA